MKPPEDPPKPPNPSDPDTIAENFIRQIKHWQEFFVSDKEPPPPGKQKRYIHCKECSHTWHQTCPCCNSNNWQATRHPERFWGEDW